MCLMCYFVFGHSDTILHPMCHMIYIFMSTSDVFCHLTFYFVLSFTIAFPHPMCHIFYIVISTWNLGFYPMCPKFMFCLPHSDYVPLPDVSYALYCHAHPVCVILTYVSFPVLLFSSSDVS